MLVSGGYPGGYEKGKRIDGLEKVNGSMVFHAGTRNGTGRGEVLTNGGRVLAVSSFGRSMHEALDISYRNADIISYEGKYFRRDIGFDLSND